MEVLASIKTILFDIYQILFDIYTNLTSVQGFVIFAFLLFTIPRILVFLRGRLSKFFKLPRILVRAFLSKQISETNELIVLISGIRTPKLILRKTQNILVDNFPNADVLKLRIDNALFSNATPSEISAQINDLIKAQFEKKLKSNKPYKKVSIVAHSIGALFAKSALLYASAGFGLGRPNFANQITFKDANWRTKLDRMVFLGGIHSGFDRFHNIWISFATFLFEFMGIGKLILACENGKPFVEILRHEWIDLLRHPKGKNAPICIQIAGDDDWAIPAENYYELETQIEDHINSDFFSFQIGGTSHLSILDMAQSDDEELSINARRAQILIDSLQYSISELESISFFAPIEHLKPKYEARQKIERIIFVYDDNRHKDVWNETINQAFKRMFSTCENLLIAHESPPILSRFSFILNIFGRREKSLRWLQNHLTKLKSQYPNASLSIIAINNGTWICAKALEENLALKIQTMFLTGSILPREFQWDNLVKQGRLGLLCNCLANEDLFCAIIGGFYAWLRRNIPLIGRLRCFYLGDSGFAGFNWISEKLGEIAYLAGTSESYFESRSTIRFSTAFAAFGGPIKEANILASEAFTAINNETDPEDILFNTVVTSDYVGDAARAVKFLNRYSWAAGFTILAVFLGSLISAGFIIFNITPFYGIAAFAIPFAVAFLVLDSY